MCNLIILPEAKKGIDPEGRKKPCKFSFPGANEPCNTISVDTIAEAFLFFRCCALWMPVEHTVVKDGRLCSVT